MSQKQPVFLNAERKKNATLKNSLNLTPKNAILAVLEHF